MSKYLQNLMANNGVESDALDVRTTFNRINKNVPLNVAKHRLQVVLTTKNIMFNGVRADQLLYDSLEKYYQLYRLMPVPFFEEKLGRRAISENFDVPLDDVLQQIDAISKVVPELITFDETPKTIRININREKARTTQNSAKLLHNLAKTLTNRDNDSFGIDKQNKNTVLEIRDTIWRQSNSRANDPTLPMFSAKFVEKNGYVGVSDVAMYNGPYARSYRSNFPEITNAFKTFTDAGIMIKKSTLENVIDDVSFANHEVIDIYQKIFSMATQYLLEEYVQKGIDEIVIPMAIDLIEKLNITGTTTDNVLSNWFESKSIPRQFIGYLGIKQMRIISTLENTEFDSIETVNTLIDDTNAMFENLKDRVTQKPVFVPRKAEERDAFGFISIANNQVPELLELIHNNAPIAEVLELFKTSTANDNLPENGINASEFKTELLPAEINATRTALLEALNAANTDFIVKNVIEHEIDQLITLVNLLDIDPSEEAENIANDYDDAHSTSNNVPEPMTENDDEVTTQDWSPTSVEEANRRALEDLRRAIQ